MILTGIKGNKNMLALVFWVVYIVAVVFGVYRDRAGVLSNLPIWVLIGVLGFAVFGFNIR